MGLYERWTATGEDATGKIAVHAFTAALREVARGRRTVAQLVTVFALDADDQADLNALGAHYTALGTVLAKEQWLLDLHGVMVLAEAGIYNKAQCTDALGF